MFLPQLFAIDIPLSPVHRLAAARRSSARCRSQYRSAVPYAEGRGDCLDLTQRDADRDGATLCSAIGKSRHKFNRSRPSRPLGL